MEEIVMVTPVIKAGSMPNNIKQEDSLLNKVNWTRDDCERLDAILEYYERTRYSNVVIQ